MLGVSNDEPPLENDRDNPMVESRAQEGPTQRSKSKEGRRCVATSASPAFLGCMTRLVRRWGLALLALLLVVIVWFGIGLYRHRAGIIAGLPGAYAQWGAAELVIHYMKTHEGKWPPDWEALRETYQSGNGQGHIGGTFRDIKTLVVIDFNVDPEELRRESIASDRVAFRVIDIRSGPRVTIGGGPNAMLRRYFRKEAGIIEPSPPQGGWDSLREKGIADS